MNYFINSGHGEGITEQQVSKSSEVQVINSSSSITSTNRFIVGVPKTLPCCGTETDTGVGPS